MRSNTLQALGPQADAVRPVFLTVDPERDTTAVMAEYTDLFDPRILGATGAPDDVAAALKSLGVYSRKVPQDDGNYTMDHTATMLLLLNAQGRPRSTLDIHEAPEIAAGKLVAINGVLRERFGIDPATVQTEHGGYAHGTNCGGHHIQAV